MKKKIWIFVILIFVTVGGLFLVFGERKNSNEQVHAFASAKTDGFESLEELEQASECIVRVRKKKEDPSVVVKDGTFLVSGYTMAEVEILEVFSNKLGEEIQEGKTIKISEEEFVDGTVVYHIAGYEKMKIGEEYILFLRKSTSDGCFLTRGIVYGKVPVKEEAKSDFAKKYEADIDASVGRIAAEAREKYTK